MAKNLATSYVARLPKKEEEIKTSSSLVKDNDIGAPLYLLGKLGAGAASKAVGAYNFIAGAFDQLAGNEFSAQKRYATNDAHAISKSLDEAHTANGFTRFMGGALEGVGQNVPTMLLSLIPAVGIPLATGANLAGYTGMGVQEAYQKTGKLGGREYIYGLGVGTMDSALDFIGGKAGGWLGGSNLGTKAVKVGGIAGKEAAKSGKLLAKEIAGKTIKGGAAEFAQEFIEAYAEVGLQKALNIDSTADVTLGEALYAGAVGFASGAFLSGATSAINTQAMRNVGKRVMTEGEADATVKAAKEIATAFKGKGKINNDAVKTLKTNIELWEATKDKNSGQAEMIIGNIRLAMSVCEVMGAQNNTFEAMAKHPEKFLPYAQAVFGNQVTIEDIKNPDSVYSRYIAAANWATGEADKIEIQAEKHLAQERIDATNEGRAYTPLVGETEWNGEDAAFRTDNGEYVLIKGNNGAYSVMVGSDVDNLTLIQPKDGSILDLAKTKEVLAKLATPTKAEEISKVEEAEEEPKKEAPKKQKISEVRESLIGEYGAEIQDKARELLPYVDTLPADRRIAVYETIKSAEGIDEDTLKGAIAYESGRKGLFLIFNAELNERYGKTKSGEVRVQGFSAYLGRTKGRLIALAKGLLGVKETVAHEVFHDIRNTGAGKVLEEYALGIANREEARKNAVIYGDLYHDQYGTETFTDFEKSGEYGDVIDAIRAYDEKNKAKNGGNTIAEEVAAKEIGTRLSTRKYAKIIIGEDGGNAIIRVLKNMVSKLKERKGADEYLKQTEILEKLYSNAAELAQRVSEAKEAQEAKEEPKAEEKKEKTEAESVEKIYIPVEDSTVKFNLAYEEKHLEDIKKQLSDHPEGQPYTFDEISGQYKRIIDMWNEVTEKTNSQFLRAWNSKKGKDRIFSIFKEQMGYKYNVELASECKKGIPLFEAINNIVAKNVMEETGITEIGKREKEILYGILKEKGFQIPCAICYVEQARQREGKIIKEFLFGQKERGKIGWNEVLDSIEKDMLKNGVEYHFEHLSRDVATDNYIAKNITMTEREQDAFYKAIVKNANRVISDMNDEVDQGKVKRKKKNKIKGSSVSQIREGLKGSLPANLEIFKTLVEEPKSRLRIDSDLLYSSITTSNLAGFHHSLYTLFNGQQGRAGYKTKQETVVYWGDLLGKKWKPSAQRSVGGIRTQSNSDFQVYTFLDLYQMYVDLTIKKYYLQAYTKVLPELKLFGLSGGKMNASAIPKVVLHIEKGKDGEMHIDVEKTRENAGLDENGNPIFDDIEGVNHEEAFALVEDKDYSKCVGICCIAYSDKHLRVLLDDKRVQLIIGFHDTTNDVNKRYIGARYAKNFNYENEAKNKSGKTVHINFNEFVISAEKMFRYGTSKQKETVDYNGKTYKVDDIPKLAADMYLELCREKGYTPAYANPSLAVDQKEQPYKHENYYKLLADFSLYDSEGHYAPHKPVKVYIPSTVPIIDGVTGEKKDVPTAEYLERELSKELEVRDAIAEELAKTGEGSIMEEFKTRAMDKDYVIGGGTLKKNKSTLSEGGLKPSIASDESHMDEYIKYSMADKDTAEKLERGRKERVYRAMQLIDGELYPPMAARIKGKDGKKSLVLRSQFGVWEQADELPQLIKNGNKFELDKANGSSISAAYNPYFHTSRSPLNDQFSSAYKRPNLVVVEGEIPTSELTSGYKAEHAKDAVGEMSWHSGPVSSRLPKGKERKVILSRWFKPVRIIPDSEVAQKIKELIDGEKVDIPYKVVTPNLLKELENIGVPIDYSGVEQPTFSISNGGYRSDGSMSNRAYEAYENGEKPLSKWTKAEILSQMSDEKAEIAKKLTLNELRRTVLERTSWHHTGLYYNETDFYSIDESAVESLTEEKVAKIADGRSKEKKNAPKYVTALVEYDKWEGTKAHPKKAVKQAIVKFMSDAKMIEVAEGEKKRKSSLRLLSFVEKDDKFPTKKELEKVFKTKEKERKLERAKSAERYSVIKGWLGGFYDTSLSGHVYAMGKKPTSRDVEEGTKRVEFRDKEAVLQEYKDGGWKDEETAPLKYSIFEDDYTDDEISGGEEGDKNMSRLQRALKEGMHRIVGGRRGELKETQADLKAAKKYSKEIAEKTIDILVRKNLPQAEKERLTNILWQGLNDSQSTDRRLEFTERMTEYIAAELIIKSVKENENLSEYKEEIEPLRKGIGRLKFTDADKAEIEHIVDKAGLKAILGRWGNKGKGAEPYYMSTFVHDYSGENNLEYLDDMHPVEAFMEMNDKYERLLDSLKNEKYVPTYLDIADSDIPKIEAGIREGIESIYKHGGKKSRLAEYREKINELYETIRDSRRNLEAATRKTNIFASAVIKAKELAEIITTGKYVNAANLPSDEAKAMGKALSKVANLKGIKSEETRELMKKMSAWYTPERIEPDGIEGKESESLYRPEIKEAIDDIASGEGFLTNEEVVELGKILGNVKKIYMESNTVIINGKRAVAKEKGKEELAVLNEIYNLTRDKRLKKKNRFTDWYWKMWDKVRNGYFMNAIIPKDVIATLEGFKKDGVLTQIFDDISHGLAAANSQYAEVMTPFVDFFKKHKGYEKRLAKERIPVGSDSMTVGQAITYYLTTWREQAKLGLEETGISWIGKDGTKKETSGSKIEDIQKTIGGALSKEDEAYIKLVKEAFDKAGKLKVDADNILFGFTNVEDGFYIPIVRDEMGRAKKTTDARQSFWDLQVVENKSFNKKTKKNAKGRLFIDDITTLLGRHIKGVAQYANLANPMRAWDGVWNAKVEGTEETVRSFVNDKLFTKKGKRGNADDYFSKLFLDIQGVRPQREVGDVVYDSLRAAFVSSALGLNIGSMLKQWGSFGAAMNYVGAKDLAIAVTMKADFDEMRKYSTVAKGRLFDRSRIVEAETNTSSGDVSKALKKYGDAATMGIQWMDNQVVGRLWNACRLYIERTEGFGRNTEENKEKAGKLLDTIINDTQSTSTADTRSAFQRGGKIMQAFTMFTSDAVKSLSYLYSGAMRRYAAQMRKDEGIGSEAELKEANKKMRDAAFSFIASVTTVVAITMIIKFLFGKKRDDDETLIGDIAMETTGQVLGIFPIVKDAYDLVANNYEVDSFVFEAINDAGNATVRLTKLLANAAKGDYVSSSEVAKAFKAGAIAAGNLTGIPVRNVEKYLSGAASRIAPKTGYGYDSLFYTKSYTKDLDKAIEDGDEAMGERILSLYLRRKATKGDIDSMAANEIIALKKNGFDVVPRMVSDEMGRKERNKIQSMYRKADGVVERLVRSDEYQSLTDEGKAKAIRGAYDAYYSNAVAETTGEKYNSRALMLDFCDSGLLFSAYGYIATLKSDEKQSRAEKVQEYLDSLEISNEEKYAILYACGYRSKTVNKAVAKMAERSEIPPKKKAQIMGKR